MDDTLTISDAAQKSGISAHTLRYWERAGLIQPVTRNGSGHRRYAEEDLERIKFLTKLRATDSSGSDVCGAAERGRRHK
jgi:DNA-binding transcriptional MerR regulator